MEPADGQRRVPIRQPETADRQRSEAAERDFFSRYFGERAYNATGWRLQKQRELRVLLDAAGGRSLGRVISIGCGDGLFERLLAPHAESVLGVDLSPVAVEVAEQQRAVEGLANVEFRCVSFRDLPWQERFDTVVCLAFLHHVPEPEIAGFLRACHDHLVPNGLFFSQDPNVHGALRALGRVVLGRRYHAYHTPDERELDAGELSAQLRAAGFASVAIRHVDLTLIPASYALPWAPAWMVHLAAWADRLWCATPLARWSSGFAAIARRD
jgi:2-polyprenyl-6-hydroxyphenyl methylase/3-demethylubiquinone-9 3-methyltransferase